MPCGKLNMKIRFYVTSSGRSPVEEFLLTCSQELRSRFYDAVSLLEDGVSLGMPVSRPLFNICHGLHELRLKDRAGQVSIFYFMKRGEAIYMLHAVRKKSQILSQKEFEIVLQRLKEV